MMGRVGSGMIRARGAQNTFSPLSLFAGVTNGGWWRGDTSGNTVSSWKDASGLNNHLSQGTAGNQFQLQTGINGQTCYRNPLYNSQSYFILPSILINRRSHSWWCVFRTRSTTFNSSRCVTSFGASLTDCMTEISTSNATYPCELRTWGTTVQYSRLIGRSDLCLLIVSADGSAVKMRYNGDQFIGSAYAAGTLTGGHLFHRLDPNFTINGEVYEFGLLDRAMTANEITSLERYSKERYRTWPSYGNLHMIGDSLTEGQDCVTYMNWAQIMDDTMGASWQVINEAAGGTYLNQWQAQAAKSAAAYRSDRTKNVFICAAGTNDLGAAAATATTTLGYLNTELTALKAAGYITTAWTIPPRDDVSWSGAKETERLSYNSSLKASPSTYHCDYVLDIAALPELANPSDTTYFSPDKLHFKDPAHVAIAAYTKNTVLSL